MTTTGAPHLVDDATTERIQLDDHCWVDVTRGWLAGADEVYRTVVERAPFEQQQNFRYERSIAEPRLTAWAKPADAPHPVLVDAHRRLQHAYGVRFDGFALSWYRDGRDSVAPHRDDDLRWTENTVIAILTLGQRRPWILRPRATKWEARGTIDLAPGAGDLLVMGGRSQVDWVHGVPKVDAPIGGRVSVQWRWAARTGRPERGPGWGAPRYFSDAR
jgi:alkylated DNA repair dioxygenase AlkB